MIVVMGCLCLIASLYAFLCINMCAHTSRSYSLELLLLDSKLEGDGSSISLLVVVNEGDDHGGTVDSLEGIIN